MVKSKYITTKNSDHRHTYMKKNKYTSYDNGHKHEVKGNLALPTKIGGHTHRIIMPVKQKGNSFSLYA